MNKGINKNAKLLRMSHFDSSLKICISLIRFNKIINILQKRWINWFCYKFTEFITRLLAATMFYCRLKNSMINPFNDHETYDFLLLSSPLIYFIHLQHHCRHCGRIFCSDCISKTVNSGPNGRSFRVCDICHTILVKDAMPYFSTEPPSTPD